MSKKTRRHPSRPRGAPVGPKLHRIESGCYETADGIHIDNRNDGKRDACWVAMNAAGDRVAHATTLREMRRKLARLAEA